MSTKTESKTTTSPSWESKIKLNNIVQISLVQTTLQANFRAILEALSQHDHDISQNKSDNKDNHDHIDSLSKQNERMEQELKNLKQLMTKLTKDNQMIKSRLQHNEISASVNTKAHEVKFTISPPNPESSQHISNQAIDALTKQLNSVKEKTNKLDTDTKKNFQQVRNQIDNLKKQLADVRKSSDYNSKIKQLEKAIKDLDNKNKQINSKINNIEGEINNKYQNEGQVQDINNIFKQLSDKLSQFIEGEYQPAYQKHDSRLAQLQKLAHQSKSSLQQEKRLRTKLNQQIWKVHESVSKMSDNNLTQEITSDTLKQLKRQISDLNKKLNDIIAHKSTLDSTIHESPSKFRVSDNESPSKAQGSKHEDLREQMLDRLKQLKSDMLKHMRKIDNKNEGDLVVDKRRLDAIDDAIMRLDHILSQKANVDQVKKLVQNIENKISYVYNIFMSESEEDACVARRNWMCLSCDKKLDKYQGKLGTHLVSAQLKAKTLQQDVVGGGMTLRPSKSRYDLPNVYKQGLKKP